VRASATRARPASPAAALSRLTRLCAAFPESARTRGGSHATFRVRGKVYAYFLDDHHGDGITAVCTKTALGEHVDRVHRDPERYYLPAYIGPRGWVALRLDRGRVDWGEVRGLLEQSYRLVAPRALARTLDAAP